ncbi:hypothetical protein PM8797T_21058 [Gimesia maris DSM 8797]|nr:hypothetical protein PM8797T_21058 [Gimesia maris DSM 8797]
MSFFFCQSQMEVHQLKGAFR